MRIKPILEGINEQNIINKLAKRIVQHLFATRIPALIEFCEKQGITVPSSPDMFDSEQLKEEYNKLSLSITNNEFIKRVLVNFPEYHYIFTNLHLELIYVPDGYELSTDALFCSKLRRITLYVRSDTDIHEYESWLTHELRHALDDYLYNITDDKPNKGTILSKPIDDEQDESDAYLKSRTEITARMSQAQNSLTKQITKYNISELSNRRLENMVLQALYHYDLVHIFNNPNSQSPDYMNNKYFKKLLNQLYKYAVHLVDQLKKETT